jgi:hypothetical protein
MTVRRTTEVEDEHGRHATAVEESVAHPTTHDAERVSDHAVTSSQAGGASVARRLLGTLALLIGIGLAFVETLLGFRLAFLLSEANAANGFVDFIYDVTDPLVEPFQGIIANDTLNSGGVFEPATVIAMVVYLVAAAFLIAIILAAAAGMGPDRNTVVTSRSRERDLATHDS